MFLNKFHVVTGRSQMHPNTTKCTKTLVYGPMGWIGSVRCEKSRRDFVARIFTLIALVYPILHRVSYSYETIQNAPNTMKRTKTWVEGPMGRIGCICCEKSRRDFVARTFALIAPVHPVLHRVSCSYEMIPNAPKTMKVQWGGLDAFVAKNPDVTSWHELLH